MFKTTAIYSRRLESLHKIPGFKPVRIDRTFLCARGFTGSISETANRLMAEASEDFARLFAINGLAADAFIEEGLLAEDSDLEVHNYTGLCPTNVLEVSPSKGACTISCQYCLVTDGSHRERITLWRNYPAVLERYLSEHHNDARFYYFSPKTEAFSEPHLESGIAHDILRVFLEHYRRYPASRARIFIASKAGPKHLFFRHGNTSILDLLSLLQTKIQYVGSIGIMPELIRDALEPNAPSVEERLDALRLCSEAGIHAMGILLQPILLPYLEEGLLETYFRKFKEAGVVNVKPEFLTVDLHNLVFVAQFINHFDPDLVPHFFAPYFQEGNESHIKQRKRMAPARDVCAKALRQIKASADGHGISISLCNWVTRELTTVDGSVPSMRDMSRKRGYHCLGYQMQMLL